MWVHVLKQMCIDLDNGYGQANLGQFPLSASLESALYPQTFRKLVREIYIIITYPT